MDIYPNLKPDPMAPFAPMSYRTAREEKKREHCNGCGSKGLGGWLVPDTLWGLSIEEECNIHDWMYSEGKTIADKEEADRVFLNNMIRRIEREKGAISKALRPLRKIRAKEYYEAVRIFGGPAFWAGKNP